jgi:hypothetical protein
MVVALADMPARIHREIEIMRKHFRRAERDTGV